jgi:hypothetical protein
MVSLVEVLNTSYSESKPRSEKGMSGQKRVVEYEGRNCL